MCLIPWLILRLRRIHNGESWAHCLAAQDLMNTVHKASHGHTTVLFLWFYLVKARSGPILRASLAISRTEQIRDNLSRQIARELLKVSGIRVKTAEKII